MEGRNQYSHCFPTPSTTVDVTEDGDVTSSCHQQRFWRKRFFAFPKPQVLSSHCTGCGENRWVSDASSVVAAVESENVTFLSAQPRRIPHVPRKRPPWEQRTASTNGRRHAGARRCSGGAVLQLKNSHVRESSFFSRTGCEFRPVLGAEKEHHRIARHCPLCARLHTGRFRREEELPRNSAKRDRLKKILPRVTCTTHPVLTAAQPARHEKKL